MGKPKSAKFFVLTLIAFFLFLCSCKTQQNRNSRYTSESETENQSSTSGSDIDDSSINNLQGECPKEDPLCADEDGDGLTKMDELNCGTSDTMKRSYGELNMDDEAACQTDSDDDGLKDSEELFCKMDPKKKDPITLVNECKQTILIREGDDIDPERPDLDDPDRDLDRDGLKYFEELKCGYDDSIPNTPEEIAFCRKILKGEVEPGMKVYLELNPTAKPSHFAGINVPSSFMKFTDFQCGPRQILVGIKGQSGYVIHMVDQIKCKTLYSDGRLGTENKWIPQKDGKYAGTRNGIDNNDFIVDCTQSGKDEVLVGMKVWSRYHNSVAVVGKCIGINTHLNEDIKALIEEKSKELLNIFDSEDLKLLMLAGGKIEGIARPGIPMYYKRQWEGLSAGILDFIESTKIKTTETGCLNAQIATGIRIWGGEEDQLYMGPKILNWKDIFVKGFQLHCTKIDQKFVVDQKKSGNSDPVLTY